MTVKASIDVSTISKNETLNLKIIATNSKGTPKIDISPLSYDFKIISGPAQQTNIQWINGEMTSSRSLSWTILAKKSGKINIPALTVIIDGKKYNTNPIGVNVKKSATKNNLANLFIEAKPDKLTAYVGEQVTITYRLYARANLSVENIEYPESEGFWNEDLRTTQTAKFRDTQINGINYKVATLYKTAMFPTQNGVATISPMTVVCNVEIPSKRGRGVFDDPFFNSMFRETQRQFIQSESIEIDVIPFPSKNPANFTGAVGQFNLQAFVDTEKVRVNEAFTYSLKLSGSGNLNQFNIQNIEFSKTMEAFPPTSSFKRDQFRDEISGEELYEFIIVPRKAGQFQLGPFDLTYFDPNQKKFITISTDVIDQLVLSNDNIAINNFTDGAKEEINLLSDDIRYIRANEVKWISGNNFTIPIWIWVTYFFSANILAIPFIFKFAKSKRNETEDDRKSKKALSTAIKAILKPGDSLYKNYSDAIYSYFKSKFQLKNDLIDPIYIKKNFNEILPSELINEIIKVLEACNAGNYGMLSPKDFKKNISLEIIALLEKIDNEIK